MNRHDHSHGDQIVRPLRLDSIMLMGAKNRTVRPMRWGRKRTVLAIAWRWRPRATRRWGTISARITVGTAASAARILQPTGTTTATTTTTGSIRREAMYIVMWVVATRWRRHRTHRGSIRARIRRITRTVHYQRTRVDRDGKRRRKRYST